MAGPLGISLDPSSPSTAVVYVLLTVSANGLVPFPPASVMCVAGVLLYGWPFGFILNVLASVLGCCLALLVVRRFRTPILELLGSSAPLWRAIDAAIVADGFRIPLLLRLTVVMPVVLGNALLSLTSVDAFTYTWTTLVGFTLASLPYAYGALVGKEMMEEFPPTDPVLIASTVFSLLATALCVFKVAEIAVVELRKAGVHVGDATDDDASTEKPAEAGTGTRALV